MIEPHQGKVDLQHTFGAAYNWLKKKGEVALRTAAGTHFTAQAAITNSGSHSGEPTIRFFQRGTEYARAYECCWRHYYNCNRTRMGMYCQALDMEAK
jgi:hypothetical protein